MRLRARLAALVYGAAVVFANPGWGAELTDAGREELKAMRAGDMTRLAIRARPRDLSDVEYTRANGRAGTLADFAGTVAVVSLWATWCPPCVKELPTLDRLHAAMDGSGVSVNAIALERKGVAKAKAFFAKHGIANLAPNADAAHSFSRHASVLGLPTTLVLDREGREIARMQGEAVWDAPEAQALLRRAAELTASPGG